MIDSHCHILPGMDDGSKSAEQSVAMLRMELENGIDRVVLTPHFYAQQNSPRQFLKRRQAAWERLQEALPEGMPRMIMGAEVQYFEGICGTEELHELCIQGTDLLLLEMPEQKWTSRMIRDVAELQDREDMTVMLAHIERFLTCTDEKTWDYLRRCGVLMQINASFLTGFWTKSKAKRMLRQGKVHFLGSDAHNLTDRKPNLTPALSCGHPLRGEPLLQQAFENLK